MKIDPEFHALIPPLFTDEYSQLEASIKAEGCRDALVLWGDILLDGHNRFEICQRHNLQFKITKIELPDREAAKDWIIVNQLGRRNLTRDQWEYLLGVRYNRAKKAHGGQIPGTRIDQNDPSSTADLLASEYGVSPATVKRSGKTAQLLDENPKEKEAVLKKRKKLGAVKKDLAKKKRKEKRKESSKDEVDSRIIFGDFREKSNDLANGSLSLIFTDPPYNKKSEVLYDGLGKFASEKLAEGGSLICYVGHIQLLNVLTVLSNHLRFWWICVCLHTGQMALMREYGIRVGWKPILWFVKKTRDDNSNIVIDVISGNQEKSHHDWQQGQSEAEYWIKNLCPKDGIVCDPFLGGGTTAVAAQSLGRKWVGFEIDQEAVGLASKRINDTKV